MKIGVSFNPGDNGYARFGKERFLKMAQNGFSAVDYSLGDTNIEEYRLSESELEKKMYAIKAEAERANVEIFQVHGPWRWPVQDATPEDRQERMEKMKRSILATRMLGCKYWVIHPIMPFGTNEIGTENAQKTWDINLEFMSELVKFAKEQDVIICLENMPMRKFSMSPPSQVLKFVKEINDDHFKICLDTGHVSVNAGTSALGDIVRELGNQLKVLHVHDNTGESDAHSWPTKGIIDWPDFLKALKDIGFEGAFALETSPSQSLNDEDFEAGFIELFNISKKLLEDAQL